MAVLTCSWPVVAARHSHHVADGPPAQRAGYQDCLSVALRYDTDAMLCTCSEL